MTRWLAVQQTLTAPQLAVIRDSGCRFPGCDRPPAWCDAHHMIHWIYCGPTNLGDLVLLCLHHHTVVRSRLFNITVDHISIRFERYPAPGPEP